ncbi:MAG: 50S ribosomal protein L11 methyltransferase, partial [Verrucomicrobiae bacterium]|nr:50S ribosomal protein L11 methyltransferase [Verrucomicrobiae bacterium]
EENNLNRSAARKEIASGLAHIRSCGLATGRAAIEIARVRREDWAESWKRHFKPMVIRGGDDQGARRSRGACSLLVKPSWSRKKPVKNQAVVILDPGLSFGTGQHPTTSFCLRELVGFRAAGEPCSFLDLGTGSGILAIAAAKLGYAPVAALDFDPEAVRVARENARRNGVADRLRPVRGDVTKLALRPARQYNLVCANLISTLLVAERQRIVRQVKPGGRLVLAGILAAEFTEVRRAYADMQMKLCSSQTQNEWCSGAFCFA